MSYKVRKLDNSVLRTVAYGLGLVAVSIAVLFASGILRVRTRTIPVRYDKPPVFALIENGASLTDIEKYLKEQPRIEDSMDPYGDGSPVFTAVSRGRSDVLEVLLNHGFSENERGGPNIQRQTPLQWAVICDNAEAARILVERGADTTLRNYEGLTAHELARKLSRTSILEVLEKQ